MAPTDLLPESIHRHYHSLSRSRPLRFHFATPYYTQHIPWLLSSFCAQLAAPSAVLLWQIACVAPHPVGTALRAAAGGSRAAETARVARAAARTAAPTSGAMDNGGRAAAQGPRAAGGSRRGDLLTYLTYGVLEARRLRASMRPAHGHAASLASPHPWGCRTVPRPAPRGVSRSNHASSPHLSLSRLSQRYPPIDRSQQPQDLSGDSNLNHPWRRGGNHHSRPR